MQPGSPCHPWEQQPSLHLDISNWIPIPTPAAPSKPVCLQAGGILYLPWLPLLSWRGKQYQWQPHRYKLLLWPGQLKPQWTLNTDCSPAINCCACRNWSIKIQACSTTAILVFLLLRKYHHKIFEFKFRPKMKALWFFPFVFCKLVP